MIKIVDLLSGVGGTVGLWLGWSILSMGDIIIDGIAKVYHVLKK